MVNFGKFSSENTVIFAAFSPKMTKVRPKYVSWGSNQEGVQITRIRYLVSGAVEPSAQRCAFAHPIFGPTVRKMQNLRTQFSGL